MALQVRECRPNELPRVIERLDYEFVVSKKRSLSLGIRFPNTLSAVNIKQIRVAVSDGVIVGALSLRMFDWVANRQLWHGAMVGMVWVDSKQRGMDVGSTLLSSAKLAMREADVDFGVLWTGTPAFYERAGWFASDHGLFGTTTTGFTSASKDAVVSRVPVASADSAWLERLRANAQLTRVIRNPIDYCTIPIPALDVLCFYVGKNTANEGFALVGGQGGIGYLYELVAPPSLWSPLFFATVGCFNQIFANGHAGDSFAQWLAENRLVEWKPQNKAMWLRVSERLDERTIRFWNIPYYDWI